MEKTELVNELTQDILTYVMHGNVVSEKDIASKIKPVDLDSRFEEFEKLMDFHFVLRSDVIEFVDRLEHELRSIKTTTDKNLKERNGYVDGRIDWSSTVKRRFSRNPSNSALFVCQDEEENYDIGENIVLKKLLSVIYHTLKDCEDFFENNYEWRQRWKKEKGDLVEEMKNKFEKNVHIQRIKKPENYEPTERMFEKAYNSRNSFYRKAADLLNKREDIFSGDKKEIRELLDKTAIRPDDEETLLELFVLFRFISVIESSMEETELKTIETGSQEVATFENNDTRIKIYHDDSARDIGLKFLFDPENDSEMPYSRPEKVELVSREIVKEYFKKSSSKPQTGRPDVILVEMKDLETEEYEYFITEVKNSTNEQTIKRGIKEALEYLAFLKKDDEWVYKDDVFGGEESGLLVIQDLENEENQSLEEQEGPIRIIEASELKGDKGERNLSKLISQIK